MAVLQISVLVFFFIFMLLRSLGAFALRDKEQIAKRVFDYTRDSRHAEDRDNPDNKDNNRMFGGLFRVLAPKKILEKAERDLMQTDIPLKAEEFVFIQTSAVVLPLILGFMVLDNPSLGMMLAVGGIIAPTLYLQQAKSRRQKKFNDQLGEALVIISNSMRAGFSFLQALDTLKKETAPPLSTEFGRALREMRLGTTTEEALGNMTKRVNSDDLELIVTAVNIQRQVGGNLAEILDSIAFTIRERVRIKGEVKTLTAQGKISGIIVGVLPLALALFITVTNPSYIMTLFRSPLGIALVAGAVVSEIIGAVLIRKIVNIEY